MTVTQEFLLVEERGHVRVLGVGQLPPGTIVHGDARRLRVSGRAPVEAPGPDLTDPELDAWRRRLESSGYSTEVEPFWSR